MKSTVLEKMFDNPPPKMGVPEEKDIPQRKPCRIPCTTEELQEHLHKYVVYLREHGADDVRIVNAREIPQDSRVLLKCTHPKCPGYGVSGSCPPYSKGNFQEAKEYLSAYTWAIVYRIDIPDEGRKYLCGPESLDSYKTKEGRHRLGSFQRYLHAPGDEIESMAFFDGHYFAINTHFGPCLIMHCEEFDQCQEIKAGVCRFPTLAKPSVEQTFCIDLIKLAGRLGWQHYMQGMSPRPKDYPEGYSSFGLGLVLID
ncbi:MAG: hypothetical protein JXD19_05360 [Deltaproteobacteria bacterium]|nr:hypothetical protein [Deltaproteobacteria bacterium]